MHEVFARFRSSVPLALYQMEARLTTAEFRSLRLWAKLAALPIFLGLAPFATASQIPSLSRLARPAAIDLNTYYSASPKPASLGLLGIGLLVVSGFVRKLNVGKTTTSTDEDALRPTGDSSSSYRRNTRSERSDKAPISDSSRYSESSNGSSETQFDRKTGKAQLPEPSN